MAAMEPHRPYAAGGPAQSNARRAVMVSHSGAGFVRASPSMTVVMSTAMQETAMQETGCNAGSGDRLRPRSGLARHDGAFHQVELSMTGSSGFCGRHGIFCPSSFIHIVHKNY
jgi:hypothetical protein